MMATDVLKQQHREFEELFRQLDTAEDDDERAALRVELADMLAAHTAVEEELFYPAALDQLGPGARIRESMEEHAVADYELYRLMSVDVGDETFSAKLATLKDLVMNHVEEEESELLPQVDGEMDRQRLDDLGERITARFQERLREGYRAVLDRSLGIAARQVAVTAPVPLRPAKKAASRAPTKRGAAQKRAASAQKRAASGQKRPAAPAQKRGAATKRAAESKKTVGRPRATDQQPAAVRNTTARGRKSSAQSQRRQTTAKKQRATR